MEEARPRLGSRVSDGAQAEMPFAIVEGEPLTTLPQDLYIPPDALEVILEAFEGPLDLLLYLIRRQNLDILNIPIAEITRQYMEYIELMRNLRLDLAGEYLLMAAMLAEIKSRMLLPRPELPVEEEEDPRAELVRRLQEYERFKQAAEDIDALQRMDRDLHQVAVVQKGRKVVRLAPEVALEDVLRAFSSVIQRVELYSHHHVELEPLSIRESMSEILARLDRQNDLVFTQLLDASRGRQGVVVSFLALLELIRTGFVEMTQAEAYSSIYLHARGAKEAIESTEGGEPEYD